MAKRSASHYREKFTFILFMALVFTGNAGRSDWTEDMEDAFAGEGEHDMKCKRKPNDKQVFCRYQRDERISLTTLSPCLCTHVIFSTEYLHPALENWNNFRSAHTYTQIMPSVSVSINDLQNISDFSQKLKDWLIDRKMDGVDMRVEEEGHLENTTWNKFLNILQEVNAHLKSGTKLLTLSVTILGNILPLLKDSQLIEILSYVDYLSIFSIHTPPGSNGYTNENYDISQMIEIFARSGVPKSKILIAVSLRNTLEHITKEPLPSEIYPESCRYLDSRTTEEIGEANTSHSLPPNQMRHQNLFESLKKQARYAEQKDFSGVDIWSLNDDDAYNTCGKKPFPLINEILDELNGEKKMFDSFTDLDIVLSTGESQLDEIQVLHKQNTNPDEMRNFKCERIGFYRHPKDCTKFYHCAEYRATSIQHSKQYAIFVYKCPRGLVYDELQGSCNWPSYSQPCQGSDELLPVPSKKYKCTIPGFHVDPEDCRWFYYCSDLGDGKLAAFEFLCPSHLLGFDEENLLCNWKWLVPICGVPQGSEQEKKTNSETYTYTLEPTDRAVTNLLIDDRFSKELNLNKLVPSSIIPQTLNVPDEKQNSNLPFSFPRAELQAVVEDKISADKLKGVDTLNRINASLITYGDNKFRDLTSSVDKITNETKENDYFGPVGRNNTDKKYGTAYWHRSWTRNASPKSPHQNEFNSFIDSIRSLRMNDNNTERSEKVQRDNSSLKVHRYGIGTVRKINLKANPLEGRGIKNEEFPNFRTNKTPDVKTNVTLANGRQQLLRNKEETLDGLINPTGNLSESYQGRSLGDATSTNYHFENTLNTQDLINDTKPYTQLKCSKLKDKNKISDASEESNFGCTGEITLFVRFKEGKEFDKYILKPNQISSSALQESKPVTLLANDTSKTNILKSQNLSLQNVERQRLLDNIKYKDKVSDKFENSRTQGRSAAVDGGTLEYHQIDTVSNSNKDNLLDLTGGQKQSEFKINLGTNNPVSESRNFDRKSETENSKQTLLDSRFKFNHIANSHIQKEERGLIPLSTKENRKASIDTKQNLMPLTFYPQGVLLNVDLNHINEIPPQILLEVDNMLKKYMSDGNIDLNLLMHNLNATAEQMPNVERGNKIKGNEIDMMINVLENILNSTDAENSHHDYNVPIVNNTEEYLILPQIVTTTIESEIANMDKKQYENISNINVTFNSHNEIVNNSSSSRNESNISEKNASRILNTSDVRNTSQNSEKILETPENKPFVRRRLFRKRKYPSIREQLEKQATPYYNTITEATVSFKTESIPILAPIRNRYPSIREQLLSKNRSDISNAVRNLIWNQRQGIRFEAVTQDVRNYYNHRANPQQFGDRIVTTETNSPVYSVYQHISVTTTLDSVTDSIAPSLSDNPRFYVTPTRITSNINLNTRIASEGFENKDFPNVNNDYEYQRKSLEDSRFRYTLPLPPVSYSAPPIIPQGEFPLNDRNQLHHSSSESTEGNYYNLKREGIRPPRKSRKLRILVKKLPTPKNDGGKFNYDKKTDEQDTNMRVPKKLLNELRTNVLKKLTHDGKSDVKLQIQFQDHVWNVPFVNNRSAVDISPVACTRAGLFQHPKDCNMFYECFWDKWLQKFTLHVFPCPVRLVYDDSIRGCSRPTFESHCRNSVEVS